MAKLYFKIASDWEEVVRLRNEIAKLKQELKGMDSTQSPAAFKSLNTQLSASTQRMDELVNKAAQAGAVMEGDFRKKIFDASQTVNGFTEKIIAQKNAIGSLQTSIRKNKELYRTITSRGNEDKGLINHIREQEKALGKERDALFNLTQEQANARLSVKRLRDEYSLYKNDGKQVVETNQNIGLSLGKALGVIGGVAALKQLGSEIIRVRGEFQSMQTAIETMVGKDMAGRLIPQIKELAKISPLTMSDMVGAEKMMLGFNIQAEDTIKYLKAISDISMGESGKFNSLTLAFSQMSAAGKLTGQDLNQMINAGFNPLQVIAEKTGKSIAVLKEEMSKGALSAEMVQQAFIDATSAGGKFFGMSENASKTINGQISMMQDALDNALNEIGKSSEGFIMSGIQGTTSLIQNYETIGKILVGMIATYGVYKTALIANITLTRGWAVAARADAVAKGIQTIATKAQTVAQLALNSAMKANPYVLVATLLASVVTAMWAFHDSTTAAERAQKRFNEQKEAAIKKEQEHKRNLEDLISTLQNESTSSFERLRAMNAIKDNYPSIFQKYIDEKGHVRDLIGLWKEYNEEVSKGKIESNKEDYEKAKADYEKKLDDYNNKSYLANTNSFVTPEQARISAKKQLDESYKYLQQWQKEVRSDELGQWQLDLKKNTDAQITAELKEMKRLQQARKNNKRYSLNVGIGSLKGVTTDAELQKRISVLESELSSRNPKSEIQNKSYWEKQKKEADAALESIASSQKKLMDAGKFDGIDAKVVESYKKNSKLLKQAEKELKVYDSSTKQEKQNDKLRQEQEKSFEKLLSFQRKNQQDEITLMKDGREKKLKQIDADFEARKAEITKKAKELVEVNKKAGLSGLNPNGLTNEQQAEIDRANKLNNDSRAKAETDMYKAEAEEMRNYLKEYGTFQQQKLAIAEEYAEKIRNAQNEGERLTLKKQKDTALQQVDINAIKADIDWAEVFGDFGGMFQKEIDSTLQKLRDYMKSDEYKKLTAIDQNEIADAVSELQIKASSDLSSVNFKKLGNLVTEYQNAVRVEMNAKDAERLAYSNLEKAQKNYETALKDGTKEQQDAAKIALDIAQHQASTTSEAVKQTGIDVNAAGNNLKDGMNAANNAINSVTDSLSKMSSGSLQGTFEGLKGLANNKQIQNLIGEGLGAALGGAVGQIVETALGLLDILRDGIGSLLADLTDLIYNAIDGVLSDLLSGDIIMKPLKSSIDGIGNILNTVTFGGFKSLLSIGSNAKEVQEAINKLTDRNEILGNSIDKLTDAMEKEAGSKSISAYKQASEYQKEQNANTLQIAREQARYSGSHHSWQYYMGWTNEQIQWARKNVDKNFSGTDSLWGLTPEQMKTLLSNADIYEQISGAGKGGYGNRVMEKLEAYADNAGKLEELTDKINESLMQVSFDGLRDSFLDSLMDMNKDAKSFSEDFSEYMQRALLNFSLGEVVDEDLKKWYDNLAELMKAQNGKLTEKQLEDARIAYDEMVQKAMGLRDELAAATGYDKISQESTSQSATSKGFQTMSQDTGEELNGRFTALQIAGEEIKNQSVVQSQSLNLLTAKADTILSINTEVKNIADETRTILANSYLELVQISENTGNSAKYLKDMKADIAEVKKNTSKL